MGWILGVFDYVVLVLEWFGCDVVGTGGLRCELLL